MKREEDCLVRHNKDIRNKFTKDDINDLPLFHYEGKIILLDSIEAMEEALHLISFEGVVGFDTETRPSFRKGQTYHPSLMQVATSSAVYLFLLKKINFNNAFKCFLENSQVIKTGVAIHDDLRSLCRLFEFYPSGVVDLAHKAKEFGMENTGLRWLAAYFLGVRISKGEQCSNWAKSDLSEKQIVYAATDAWISLAIYLRMQEKEVLIKKTV